MPIKAAEPGRGERFIDRRVRIQPGITLRHHPGITGEEPGEFRIEQIGMRRAASVMKQSHNRPDAKFTQAVQPPVRPAPIDFTISRGHSLPEHGITNGFEADLPQQFQIALPVRVAGKLQLVHIAFAHAIDSAFKAAP